MAEVTTLERTPETTETEAATLAPTLEEREADATTTAADAGENQEEATPEAEPDPTATLLKTAREQWEAEQAEARDRQADEEKRKAKKAERDAKVKDPLGNIKRDSRGKLGTITVRGEDGEMFPITLSDAFLKEAVDEVVDKAGLTIRTGVEYGVREDVIEAVVATLPAAERPKATEKLTGLLELDDRGQFVQSAADVAKGLKDIYVRDPKTMTKDDLPAHLKTAWEAEKAAEYIKGRKNPYLAGETGETNGRASSSNEPRNRDEAEAMFAASRGLSADKQKLAEWRRKFPLR